VQLAVPPTDNRQPATALHYITLHSSL